MSSGGTTGGTDGGTPDGGSEPFEPHELCTTDDDCPGARCQRFGTDGPRVCVAASFPPNAVDCREDSACCSHDDCSDDGGRCVTRTTQSTCNDGGSAGNSLVNACAWDSCQDDDSCGPNAVCAPEGLELVRRCIPAACRSDADCTDEPGGACRYVRGGCCYAPNIRGFLSFTDRLACVYPSDGCQADSDCDSTPGALMWCLPDGGRLQCRSECGAAL